MRRYRNARYAPETLERKLNPSTMGVAPVAAEVATMTSAPAPAPAFAAPTVATVNTMSVASAAPTVVVPPVASVVASSATVIVDGSEGYGFDGPNYSLNYTTVVDLSSSAAPSWSGPMTDYLLAATGDGDGDGDGDGNGDNEPFPGEGPGPFVPLPNPGGPVGPG